MTMLVSSPLAKAASAALKATVIVMGFSKVVSVVRSNVFSVA